MKLSVTEQAAAHLEGLKSTKFGFQMNAKMYDIVINKMYQNKSGAVLRELSCNAYDSHVDAGCPERPFEIHLPSWLDLNFSIRDYGTGIPHDSFEDIFTNVGKSTKEDSNEFIGAYGLGSKTPFTLTDTFIVENWCQGEKSTWVCFKSTGTPEVSLVGKEPMEQGDENGIKVSFSFEDKNEANRFKQEIKEQLKFFPVKPIVTGEGSQGISWPNYDKPKDADYTYITEQGSSYNRSHYVVMGNVCYPFNHRNLGQSHGVLDTGKSLVIYANLGDVDIPPSRESLEFTEKTKRYLNAKCEKIHSEYREKAVKQLENAETLSEAKILYSKMNTRLLNFKNDTTIVTKGGSFDIGVISNSTIDTKYGVRRLNYRDNLETYSINVNQLISNASVYFVMDLTQGFSKHIKANVQKIRLKYLNKHHIFIMPQSKYSKKTLDTDVSSCITQFKQETGIALLKLSDLVGQPVISKSNGPRTPVDQVFTWDGNFSDSVSRMKKDYTEADLPSKGYYVEISRWSAIGVNCNLVGLLKGFKGYHKDKDLPVYFIRSKTVPKLPSTLKPLVSIKGEIREAFLKGTEEAFRKAEVADLIDEYGVTGEILKYLKIPAITTILRYKRILDKQGSTYTLRNLHHLITGNSKVSREMKDIKNDKRNAKLLKLLEWYKNNASHAEELIRRSHYYWEKDKALGIKQLIQLTKEFKQQ